MITFKNGKEARIRGCAPPWVWDMYQTARDIHHGNGESLAGYRRCIFCVNNEAEWSRLLEKRDLLAVEEELLYAHNPTIDVNGEIRYTSWNMCRCCIHYNIENMVKLEDLDIVGSSCCTDYGVMIAKWLLDSECGLADPID